MRGAFCATKQSPLFYQGIASLKNRLRQKTPRNDRSRCFWTDTNDDNQLFNRFAQNGFVIKASFSQTILSGLRKVTPARRKYFPELRNQTPEPRSYFPKLWKYTPGHQSHFPELRKHTPGRQSHFPDLRKQTPAHKVTFPN